MPKPKLFVASSVEKLDLAYTIQEELDHDVEATVWSQGVFGLSRSNYSSLSDILNISDFGLFIFSPDDTSRIRSKELNVVRDNVIFELGMFVGKLSMERCFIFVPKGVEDLHLPTDLAGINPAYYSADRQDGNMRAALGPACNQVRTVIRRIWQDQKNISPETTIQQFEERLVNNENDCIALIQSWMGARPSTHNTRAIRYSEVDRVLKLEPGSSKKYIEIAASKWQYVVERKGDDVILFVEGRRAYDRNSGTSWMSS